MDKPELETPETEKPEGELQAIEGYACSCGFTTPDLTEYRRHTLSNAKDSGNHKSLGRVNFETGEVLMPPAKERTKEQWQEAKYGRKTEKPGSPGVKPVDLAAAAMQIRFVPRVYTIDYSPILRIAQDAATKYWGWRPEMPLGNFLDTVIYLYFKEKGITLAGYIVEETEEEQVEREAMVAEYNKVEVAHD